MRADRDAALRLLRGLRRAGFIPAGPWLRAVDRLLVRAGYGERGEG